MELLGEMAVVTISIGRCLSILSDGSAGVAEDAVIELCGLGKRIDGWKIANIPIILMSAIGSQSKCRRCSRPQNTQTQYL